MPTPFFLRRAQVIRRRDLSKFLGGFIGSMYHFYRRLFLSRLWPYQCGVLSNTDSVALVGFAVSSLGWWYAMRRRQQRDYREAIEGREQHARSNCVECAR